MKRIHIPILWTLAGLLLLSMAFPLSARQRKPRRSADRKETVSAPKHVAAPAPFRNRVHDSFVNYFQRGVQEKLYLMTDKPYYSAGEKIWFKGFLVNAVTLAPNSLSNYIYVELVDSRDSLLQRVKVKADSSGFHNSLPLSPQMQEGEYYLRAYTRWMLNESPDYLFGRRITVVNPIEVTVNGTMHYALQPNGKVEATLRLVDSAQEPLQKLTLTYTVDQGGRSRSFKARTDDRGAVRFSFTPMPDSIRGSIHVAIDEAFAYYRHRFDMPLFDTDFDVQFFPEGGRLFDVASQMVAFKAIGTNGLGVDVACKLLREDGTVLAEFASMHKGMGKFCIVPAVDERYYVEAATPYKTKRFALPASSPTGCAIGVATRNDRLFYRITATPDIDPSRLCLVVHTRGHLLLTEENLQPGTTCQFDVEPLPEGIMSFTVVDKWTGQPLSERLVFIRHGQDEAKGTITPNRSNYYRRDRIDLSVKVTDSRGEPVAGTFALSVTDRRSVVRDSLADNIHSNLLLTSDLKGHIEDPGYYFADWDPARKEHLDLLLMTQGWTRFDLADVLAHMLLPYEIEAETTQFISGYVTGLFNNDAKDPQIIFFSPQTGYMDKFQLTDTNRFRFTDLDFADSTTFVLQAMNRMGRGTYALTLNIHPEPFPPTRAHIPRLSFDRLAPGPPDLFLIQSKKQFYNDGGESLINLPEVTVTARRIPREPLIYGVEPTRSIFSEKLDEMRMLPMHVVLQTIPGVRTHPNGLDVHIRGSYDTAVLYIDNIQVPMSDIYELDMYDIESIHVVEGPEAAQFGLMGSGGVILVQLVTGRSYTDTRPPLPSIAKVAHLGYKKPDAYYQPKYEVAAILRNNTPDLRTTICWEPALVTDSTGVATVSFYAADTPSTYDVVLEGVARNGGICRSTATIRRDR